jgi:hypothetical protein
MINIAPSRKRAKSNPDLGTPVKTNKLEANIKKAVYFMIIGKCGSKVFGEINSGI